MAQVKTYTKKERNMYLTGLFGQNMIYNIVATGLYYYFQNVICLPAIALGWLFAVARVWDAINDPMMGTIVDKTRTKWGKCRPYLIFAPAVICLITCLTFINGNYAEAKAAGQSTTMILIVGWAAVSYILWGMSYTVADIPLWGIISRMSEDEKDRSTLISLARMIASIAGGVITVSIVAVSQAANGIFSKPANAQMGFIVVCIAFTIISSILFQFAGIGTREKVPVSEESKTMKESFALMWNCKPFRRLLISGILRSPMQLMMIVVMTLFAYYYCAGDLANAFTSPKILIIIAIIGGGFFLGQFIAMGICPNLLKKFDSKKVYNVFGIGSAIPMALIYLIYKLDPTGLDKMHWVIIIGILILGAGAGLGGASVCQSVMISDCIDYEEYHHGFRPDGVFFSGQSFITKFQAGISSIISAYVYAAVGYTDVNIAAMNEALEKGASFAKDFTPYADAMWLLISIPPAIGMAISVIPTIKYEIDRKSHEKMLAELVERHSEADDEEKTA
ncbi:MAG: glycoside-pentoside-hexuronide (GPH):cation symporter [Eubacterium sp.]|nr:glycoside-pentoside-hexuronide (GPH):cation symporter [Eubacterium sp.]